MKDYQVKEGVLWIMLLLILILSCISVYNSFDNEREYYLIEKVDEIQLKLNNIEEHQRYIEIELEENIYELD